jgi:hypothetical protein
VFRRIRAQTRAQLPQGSDVVGVVGVKRPYIAEGLVGVVGMVVLQCLPSLVGLVALEGLLRLGLPDILLCPL